MFRLKLKLKQKIKGFSLMEMLVSIAIFGIMSIYMSNIIISMARFSMLNDIRNDLVSELDNAAAKLKNDLRGAEQIDVCKRPGNNKNFITRRVNGINFILDVDAQNRLVWFRMGGACNPAIGNPEAILTSNTLLRIDNSMPLPGGGGSTNGLSVSIAEDGRSSNPNRLISIAIDACDINQRVYSCDGNRNYRYFIAISSRN
jgi:prepilin-type N-terminal cleavage/methylation domain-containing protein